MIVLSTIPKKSFQPKILVFTFPILVDVMHSDMSTQGTDSAKPGDIHLGSSSIIIFQMGARAMGFSLPLSTCGRVRGLEEDAHWRLPMYSS